MLELGTIDKDQQEQVENWDDMWMYPTIIFY